MSVQHTGQGVSPVFDAVTQRGRYPARAWALVASAALLAASITVPIIAVARTNQVIDPTGDVARAALRGASPVWTSPPSDPGNGTTDDPLLGNGDLGVMTAGAADSQTYYVGKNDFFDTEGYLRPVARVQLSAPGLAASRAPSGTTTTYRVEQDIATGRLLGTFGSGPTTLTTTAQLSNDNLFVLNLSLAASSSAQDVTLRLTESVGATAFRPARRDNTVYADTYAGGSPSATSARLAALTFNGTSRVQPDASDAFALHLQPGSQYTFVLGVRTNVDDEQFYTTILDRMQALSPTDVTTKLAEATAWWFDYWGKSYVTVPQTSIQQSWFRSLYILGSASRSGHTPPGIYGSWLQNANNPGGNYWGGNYTLNYNYEIPMQAALSSNHRDQVVNYSQPILDYQANAETSAANGQGTSTPFRTGFESGDPQLAASSPTTTHVTGLCCGLQGLEIGPRSSDGGRGEYPHAGQSSLLYSGKADVSPPTTVRSTATATLFDWSKSPVSVGSAKTLSYWIYPQSHAGNSNVPVGATNASGNGDSACVAIDLQFTDGTRLSDSGALNQDGYPHSAHDSCNTLALDEWNHVIVNLATENSARSIEKVLLTYDQYGSFSGETERGFRGSLTTSR